MGVKNMRNHLISCLLIFGLLATGCSSGESSSGEMQKMNLALGLSTEKQIYQYGEDIVVSLVLTNTGDDEVIVKDRMVPGWPGEPQGYRDVALFIKDNTGQEIPFMARINVYPPTKDVFITLLPDQSIDVTLNIWKLYYFDLAGSKAKTYTMYATYYNDYSPPDFSLPWMGEITSDTVQFEIRLMP
jgi:hypothetical protein